MPLLRNILLLATASCLISGIACAATPFLDRGFIDHKNLRYLRANESELASQVAEIKSNLDKAAEYGMTHYILFSRGFEFVIAYDFEVEGAGNIGGETFPKDSAHRRNVEMHGKALREALRYGRTKGIRMIFHTNQFEFPDEIYARFGDRMKGTAGVCPGKEFVWQIFRGKIREFFSRYPECDGLQITADETQISTLSCQCDDCKGMSAGRRVDKMISEAAAVCKELGKELHARTWGRVGELEQERDSSTMFDHLPEGVIISIKNTRGDFYVTEPISEMIGHGADRQVVEFDCWGEYMGWNNFPCYMGDVMAERMKQCAEKGVKRVAGRLSWNPMTNYVFDTPWGNEVNVYVFSRLAQDPTKDSDELLREWIASKWPEDAREAAFRLYKRSRGFQTVWMTYRGRNANDHSRILYRSSSTFERVSEKLGSFIKEGHRFPAADMERQRQGIDLAMRGAERMIQDLGGSIPDAWREGLLRGARTEWYVAHGITDQMELLRIGLDVKDGKPLPDLTKLEKSIRSRAEEWKKSDPSAFDLYHGAAPSLMLEEVRTMGK